VAFPNPSITGSAIGKALDPNQALAAQLDATSAHAALDETELHELERAEYYGDKPAASAAVNEPRRSLLDRLLRR
jgi:hypothetical protein